MVGFLTQLGQSTVLDVDLLARVRVIDAVRALGVDVEAHVARYQAALSALGVAGLGINDAVASLSGLHKLGILLLEDGEVAFGFPVPDRVGREDEVHFFERALVRFGVEGPYDDDGGRVDGTEEVKGLFVEFLEDGGEKEHLGLRSVKGHGCEGMMECSPSSRCRSTNQPHPTRYLSLELPKGRSRPGIAKAR